MKHPYFHKAVAEAYQNILPAEAIPTYFIFMETDPASIDINIHPTKTEIKFEDERAIWQILMASVREALGRFNIVPSLDFENEALIDIPVRSSSDTLPQPPGIEINPGYNPFDREDFSAARPGFIDRFERENNANWEKLYTSFEKGNESAPIIEKINETGRKFFQVKNKYIACPVKSGLMLMDQKRAHERVLYEKFLDCLSKNNPVSQSELFPVVVELNPTDVLVLKEIEEGIKVLGFDILFQENNKILIKGRPADFLATDPAEMLGIIIDEFKAREADPSAGWKERLAAAMAGASAIPYGKTLDQSEMENLFDILFACSSPNYSPKGKLVITIITLDDLDNKFK
jgi:DNA mismatch repair protein MutL